MDTGIAVFVDRLCGSVYKISFVQESLSIWYASFQDVEYSTELASAKILSVLQSWQQYCQR
jgi:hypothetical protein